MARRDRPAGGPLGVRAQAILRAVIEEYVVSATPVGSAALVERYHLGLSSATVRGVLADLEAAGLLTHPHTSAGRIPTDRGYRFYVEALADSTTLPAVEQLMIRHQFGQVQFASDHWFRLAATTLATMTGAAGLATAAKPAATRLRRLDLVAQDQLASFILVPREGTIKQGQLSLHRRVDQAELTRVANRLNAELVDLTASGIEALVPVFFAEAARPGVDADSADARESVLTGRVAERIARTMRESDAASIEEVYSDGLLNVMEEPEFAQSEKLRRVFSALENRAYLGDLLGTMSGSGRIHVFIGHENAPADMRDVSLVLARYGRPGRAIGVVGVLGPTRMAYPHAIGTVGFVSGLMNELVDHLYS